MIYDLALYWYELCQLTLSLFGKARKKIGWELVPKEPCLGVSNHTFLSDAQSVSACFSHHRQVHWLSNPKLYDRKVFVAEEVKKGKNRLLAKAISFPVCFVVRNSGTIPNDDKGHFSCVTALKKGEDVGMFPSGTRGGSPKVSAGFVYIAIRAEVGILAIHTDKKEVRVVRYYRPEEVAELKKKTKKEKVAFAYRVMGLDTP